MRENVGFTILLSKPLNRTAEVVLGQRESDGTLVTWLCSGGTNYFWGHYFAKENLLDAMRDFIERCER